MANKYLILGAAFNGDGTTSSEAASNGAAGAWNQQSILTGTAPSYGTISAGDTVFIRSKTGNGANANISISHTSATLGSGNASSTAPITWVLDAGTKWSGVAGTMTWTGSNIAHQIRFKTYNRFISEAPDSWVIKNTASGNALVTFSASNDEWSAFGLSFDCSASSGTYQCIVIDNPQSSAYLENCSFIGPPNISTITLIQLQSSGACLQLVNPRIVLSNTISRIFGVAGAGDKLRVCGGSLTGAGATTGTTLFDFPNAFLGSIDFVGFQYPMTVAEGGAPNSAWPIGVRVTGADGGPGSVVKERWGIASSRSDGYFPTLNAVLPDTSASGWSWYVYPDSTLPNEPWTLPVTGKFYTGSPAAKTITLSLLVSQSWGGSEVDTSNLWVSVCYVDDTTGAVKYVTSKALPDAAATLASSSAAWSATTYGAVNFNKRYISVTTPTSIKQNTVVWSAVMGTQKASSSAKIFFVDPDVQLS